MRKYTKKIYVNLIVVFIFALMIPMQVYAGNPFSRGQCTWWAYERWTQLLGYEPAWISGNAGGWYDNCVSKGYSRGSEPRVGAIVCWNNGNGNDTGHVAIVEAVYPDHISISEYNWNTPLGYGTANVYFSNINRSSSSKPSRHLKGYIYLPGTTGKNPSGTIDSVVGGVHTIRVGGWAYDGDDTSKALQIHVYVGGEAGSGAPGYAITADKLRTDVHNAFGVGNYHGYDEEIVVETYGTKDVYIYAINVGGGENVCIGKKTVTISQGPGTSYEDLGTNFYAKITNTQLGTIIANQNGYATSRTNTASADRLWKFERQSDKSYKIINCLDGTVLDVDHALTDKCTKVLSCSSNGNSNQRWFINKNGNGYSLMPAHASGMALDIWKLSAADGAEIVICPWTNNDKAEIFKIEKVTDLSNYYGKVTKLKIYSDSERKNECTQFEEGATAYFSISGENASQFKFTLTDSSGSDEKLITAGGWNLSDLKAGSYTLKVTPVNAISSTDGAATINYKVVRKLTTDMVTLGTNSYTYNGSQKKPSVTVKNGTTTLVAGTDYSIAYANNTNVGTATVTVTGKGNYVGTVSKTFTIGKANQNLQTSISKSTIKVGETATITTNGQGTLSYSTSNSSVATVKSNGIVTGTGEGSATITVSASGDANYNSIQKTVTVMVEKKMTNVTDISGDVNKDAVVNMKDYSLLQQYLTGWDVVIDTEAADVNADGSVDMKDYSLLQRYLNGWDVKLE